MTSSRPPSVLARAGAGALGLGLGAIAAAGIAPMFRAASSSTSPSAPARVVADRAPQAPAGCVSELGGGGWRLAGIALTRAQLGCVPPEPATRAEGRPRLPARGERNAVRRAPPVESRPVVEARSLSPAEPATGPEPDTSGAVASSLGMPPPATVPTPTTVRTPAVEPVPSPAVTLPPVVETPEISHPGRPVPKPRRDKAKD
jgi:hypothetical protein